MSHSGSYTISYTAAARRQMNRLPLDAAVAMHEHLTGPVADNPRRLGKRLDPPLERLRSTRRGEYRALYEIDDKEILVSVVTVAHRRDAYRSH
ncbi:mRNA-degrading endonuclease RelE of RelBE toxin-antitoxin system [Halopolyspora algeriensis]|uniref:mRNA-degrading endonuclease RelE of RelBE toxin-antitoxin system n=1 Tax=Halopolyspora algeriensis TaxID=1500506 RepID=A0A368VNQ0_9ACTN|nr:type II toxin-antitoxin system RelE/ParE family toxin [Halopolyspora algeriensis]RCW43148.1 mRNA-degrading endonuclease RelE of RelBE toxin-antitoxin system [Halopolyspora algeriensis]TQM56206.1 mRNA-degrading endonuclease RelE of RelBE toxin-antitoxin system [Halopolyspora algeriensis]